MARKLSNWLDAYCEWAEDGFTPPQFNRWVGLSLIAAALERKVWLPWAGGYSYKPNIYVMLVNRPGTGKSRAGNKGFEILSEAAAKCSITVLPDQVTESAFFNVMKSRQQFTYRGKDFGHTSAFYYAREASSSLKDIWGGFIALLTDLYDCPPVKTNVTNAHGKREIVNGCINILACSTPDYLGKLLSDENISGGFASRVIYVTNKDHSVKPQKFQGGEIDAFNSHDLTTDKMFNDLVHDLIEINKMVGPYRGDAGYGERWETWDIANQERMRTVKSEKVQDALVRSGTNTFKVSMLLSAAESDDLMLKTHHWDQAVELVASCNELVPQILTETRASKMTQQGLAMMIMKLAQEKPKRRDLKAKLIAQGFAPRTVQETLNSMFETGILEHLDGESVNVLANPHDHI